MGQRLVGATEAAIERAMDDGSILRTHVLRPTWHFVAPADIRWMLALTAPRVRAASAGQWRNYELNEADFRRCNSAIAKALRGGNQLTRAGLSAALARAKVDVTSSVRVGHITMRAELDGLICSGGRQGKQFTYALLEERVPASREITRDEALVELAMRYFTTHGPATPKDFAWWSGLTIADAKAALAMIGGDLEHETVDGQYRVVRGYDGSARLQACRPPSAKLRRVRRGPGGPQRDDEAPAHHDRVRYEGARVR